MKIDSDVYANSRKLIGEERYKKLYHYTSFDSFVKIWLNQNLKYSPLSNVNDILEVDFETAVINSDRIDLCRRLNEYRLSYKQISFTMDYDSALKGCMSPMMWGLYADKRKGVCIELDYDKIHFSESTLRDVVSYKKYLKKQNIVDEKIETEKGLEEYVKKHQKRLFFTKQKSWEGENEYRVLSNADDFLNITGAVTAVYLTSYYSQECLLVEKLVNGQVPVKYLSYIRTYNNWAIPFLQETQEQREYDLRLLAKKQRKNDNSR